MEEKKKGRNKNRHCGFFMCHGPLILLIIPRRLYYFHCIVRKWKFKEVKSPAQVYSETKQHSTKICLVLKVMYFPPNCTVPCSKGNITQQLHGLGVFLSPDFGCILLDASVSPMLLRSINIQEISYQ